MSLDFISSLCVMLALLAKDFGILILLLGFPADCSANSTVLEIRCLQSACPTAESCLSSNCSKVVWNSLKSYLQRLKELNLSRYTRGMYEEVNWEH